MAPKLPLPRGWKCRVRSSVLHILALSHYTFTALLARAANSMVSFRREAMRRELALFMRWYNAHRPHGPLGVRTPDEVYGGTASAQPH